MKLTALALLVASLSMLQGCFNEPEHVDKDTDRSRCKSPTRPLRSRRLGNPPTTSLSERAPQSAEAWGAGLRRWAG
jgi:hypothetical protein